MAVQKSPLFGGLLSLVHFVPISYNLQTEQDNIEFLEARDVGNQTIQVLI
jgi:hypothetical protein